MELILLHWKPFGAQLFHLFYIIWGEESKLNSAIAAKGHFLGHAYAITVTYVIIDNNDRGQLLHFERMESFSRISFTLSLTG